MKRNHGEPTTGLQQPWQLWKDRFQRPQLIIDGNPERLKNSGCRVYTLVGSSGHASADDTSQLGRRV
jgi:hypothetical protein